jgi:hypothetical protein
VRGAARARRGALALALAALAATLTLAALARAGEPPVAGGEVPSTLSLALGDPSPFTRSGPGLFTATLRAVVTSTVAPVRLSLGEAAAPLRRWREPVSHAPATIHLRRSAPAARALRRHGGLLWVTLTAGGP